MVKESMSMLWHTALSVIDVGSSIMYYLLGRDLDESDILLIQKMFKHISSAECTQQMTRPSTEGKICEFIELIQKLKKGKDLLLVTSKSNGYNILQTSIANHLADSNAKHQPRFQLIEALLKYGSDPNRGLVLANKKHLVVNSDFYLTSHAIAHEALEPIAKGEVLSPKAKEDDKKSDDTLFAMEKNTSRPVYFDSDSSDSMMATDMRNVSHLTPVSAENLDILNSTPIDTPLLLVCCIYNCHNLMNLCNRTMRSFDNITDARKLEESTGQIRLYNSTQASNVSRIERIRSKNKGLSSGSDTCSSDSQDSSDTESTVSSTGSSVYETEGEMAGVTKCQSDEECLDDLSKKPSQVKEDSSSSSDDEERDEDDVDTEKRLDDIYNYDQDENYFDKYEYDSNSNIYNLNSTFQYSLLGNCANTVKNNSQMTLREAVSLTSVAELSDCKRSSSQTNNPVRGRNLKYDTLNRERLALIDLLLKYDADKYLVAKLSTASFNRLNRKTQNMLRKWYDAPKVIKPKHRDHQQQQMISELRPFSPLMASLCLDDVEVFSRLYKHHHMLFNYFKPDEDFDLIYYAIKFQSENCLIYLLSSSNSRSLNPTPVLSNSLSLPTNLNISDADVNHTTLFYIIENTRSTKIVNMLLKCGFDLTKSEPFTGNTALHCLFNETNTLRFDSLKCQLALRTCDMEQQQRTTVGNMKTLDEFYTPKNLSRILFTLLRNGGLKPYVNTANYEHKVCMQVLFEWTELIETVFFRPCSQQQEAEMSMRAREWKAEMETCVMLLLKSGANLFVPNLPADSGFSHNCVDTLMKSLLRHTMPQMKDKTSGLNQRQRAKSPLNLVPTSPSSQTQAQRTISNKDSYVSSNSQRVTFRQVYIQQQNNSITAKSLDARFLLHLLANVMKLEQTEDELLSHSNKKRPRHVYQRSHVHKSYQNSQTAGITSAVKEEERVYNGLIGNYLTLLMQSYVDDFESAFKLLKLLCKFEKQLALASTGNDSVPPVDPSLVKRLISQWILSPSFLSSSRQFEKNYFIKSCLVYLITNDLYNPNDCFTYYNEKNVLISNNLFNHCINLVTQSRTAYQQELIYDLARTLIQYGADPNLDPYQLNSAHQSQMITASSNQIKLSQFKGHNMTSPSNAGEISLKRVRSKSILSQLCDSVRLPNGLTPFNLKQDEQDKHLQLYCPAKQPHLRQIYERDYATSSPNTNMAKTSTNTNNRNQIEESNSYFSSYFNDKYFSLESTDSFDSPRCDFNIASKKSRSSSPILLLTPAPSYESILLLSGSTYNAQASNNIIIDSSVLLLGHYKNFLRLLYDSMDSRTIQKCLKYKSERHQEGHLSSAGHHHHHHHHSHGHHHYHGYHHHHQHSHHQHRNGHYIGNNNQQQQQSQQEVTSTSQKLYPVETLDTYLERIASTPRSLKSITRRHILSDLTKSNKHNSVHVTRSCPELHANDAAAIKRASSTSAAVKIMQLDLPTKLKEYLLFVE